ncbi:zinc-dependent metalloprotease [Shewanella schlegeliana]|uniref:Zinc-dependent metalloprotease n=1 Tax=Shewanella schlegeliana TaxID=190308 RepID=A0ABS1SWS1_9GAMM|nr:zinc-dependent metalloprotease [Shewanella schlegeliana]MBL4912952.1 zinc-dependent metalloprotease [Shewanella schlegeliana]MCL1108952.1 zinc-dependent metalloprotease [Shewanella schlegeliana]GIU23570.1 periplasmic metalloprotease [Shewanella schlegeliana]
MRPYKLALAIALAVVPMTSAVAATTNTATLIKKSQAATGFINLFYDKASGDLYLEANKLEQPFLMLTSLPHGVGSNDIGLDRGQLGRTRMVQFERHGPYLILKQLNTHYRADTDNAAEQRAVKEAFAESVLWRGKLVTGKRNLVAINDLVVNDLHGISDVLEHTKQGSYQLDPSKSLILPEGVKSFERNSDIDVLLTFNAAKEGNYVAQVTPDAKHLSVRLRYSFIALPEEGYQARAYHPLSGYLSDEYLDYGTRVDEDIRQRFLLRHRLQKVTPGSAPSQVVKPITYYLDPGVPEPIRTALLEGASWWEDAFTDAGFINGFKVELLPEDADPQDVRYNVIQWVHRATRGWSYGSAVTDPRTGEIIKGHVTLGSQRVRQDHLIARGLTAGWEDRAAADDASMALALARIRQLSAHEVGHTLGLDHNFSSSSNNNASVMDYPHPMVTINGDKIDISKPYDEGIGAWDKYTVAYGYGEYGASEEEAQGLAKLRDDVAKQGLRYIGEADSRTAGASNAYASLWDNGNDPVAELTRLGEVRAKAMNDFSAEALLAEQPQGELQDAFVPIYLLTRFQIAAAAKMIGGTTYSYSDGVDGQTWHYVAPAIQQQALEALLATLSPNALVVDEKLQELLVPKAGNYYKTRESFDSGLGVITDPLAMAEVLSRLTLSQIYAPERINRVNQAYLSDKEQLSVTKLTDKVLASTLFNDIPTGPELGVWMRVNTVTIDSLLAAFHDPKTRPEVKAQLAERLAYTVKQLKRKVKRVSAYEAAHYAWLQQGIEKGLKDAKHKLIAKPLSLPPGSPI